MRLAALSKLPVIYIYTHDSVGVGEDGPTHQPVETISALRLIPGFEVIRPADPEETAGAFAAALERTDGPTLLALTRQAVPDLNEIPAAHPPRRASSRAATSPCRRPRRSTLILLASGSELQLRAGRRQAARRRHARRLDALLRDLRPRSRPNTARASCPPSCRKRVAIEAGVTGLWRKYVGLEGKVVGIDRFGLSAPAPMVFKELGITTEALVAAARSL